VPNFLKRIIFIWHRKLFREISFSLLQKPRSVDIIHREEEKKKRRKRKERNEKDDDEEKELSKLRSSCEL